MRLLTLALAALAFAPPAWSQKVDNIGALNQEEFQRLSADLGGVFSYRAQAPAAPLGAGYFDLGIAGTRAKLEHPDLLDRASSQDTSDTVTLSTLRASAGLPNGFDIGLAVGWVEGSTMMYYGGELRWGIVPEEGWPTIGVRASLSGVSRSAQVDLGTAGVDVSVSKRFGFATPYVGLGRVRVSTDPKGIAGLQAESLALGKAMVGVGMKFALISLNLEADKTGDVTAYSAKIGLHF